MVSVIDTIEAHVRLGSGALVRARHPAVANLPGDFADVHWLLARYTTALHGDTDRPKHRPRRKAQRRARRRSR